MAKRIFITGIAGFIGFHLALALKNQGDSVVGCDNFNSYYDPSLKLKRAALLKEQDIPCVTCDICEAEVIKKIVGDYEITHFVHLAAQAGVRYSMQNPDKYVHTNLDGFVQILEVCRSRPHMRCIFASSSSVYGLNKKLPFSENDPTDCPTSLYGATKKANEVIAHAYHHLYGIPLIGLRFFTVYGPWGRPDMAYFSFTRDILAGNPIHVFGEGLLQRDFTYIDDIIQGTLAALDYEGGYEIFNLGNNRSESVLDLIAVIEKNTGKKALVELHPMQPGDVTATCADISKSQKMLRFSPKTSLHEGMEHFIKWYKEHYSNELE